MSNPYTPLEQLPVPLFDGVVLAVRGPDAAIYLSFQDLCDVVGVEYPAQRRRARASATFSLTPFRVLIERPQRQLRDVDFLLLDAVPLWVLSVQVSRVGEEQRSRFSYIQTYLIGAVQAAFAQLTGLPNVPSSQIEDLSMLDRMDQAFQQLSALTERQAAIEDSQQRARVVFRDLQRTIDELRTRVQELENKQKLSPEQRGTIHSMVEAWGEATARGGTPRGIAIRNGWRLLNARFGVATYTDLPAGRYDEIIQFLKNQYHEVTGTDLPANEQRGMDL